MKLFRGSQLRISRPKLAGATAVLALAMAAFASSAQACSYTDTQQIFSPWGDQRDYQLTPDGGFESGGAGWSLKGDSAVIGGNESFYVNDAGDSQSLSIPDDSSATSPSVCVGRDTPVFRLFARNTGRSSSRLQVTVVYDLPGRVDPKIGRTIRADADWSPTPAMSTVPGLAELAGSMKVQFKPLDDNGNWQVDDLYIDPFARH